MVSGPSGAPAVFLEGIGKGFPGVVALAGIDLACRAGEVHVLLGENGAGKSTLVALLAGLHRPDAGRIHVDGRPVRLGSPRAALQHGIGVLLQHPVLVPGLTVIDNVALGRASLWRPIDRSGLACRIRAVADAAGLACDPEARAGDLSLGERQQVATVQALLRGTRLLVLDEVTATLTPARAAAMGALMRRAAGRGVAVLWITHRIDEALASGDRITVLRQGRTAGEIAPDALRSADRDTATAAVLSLMFGAPRLPRQGATGEAVEPGVPVFEVRGLAVDDLRAPVRNVDLTLRAGEILGLAGIDGNGQGPLAEALAGQRPVAAGRIRLGGTALDRLGVRQRRTLGLGYATDDRLREGTVGDLSVAANLLLKEIGDRPFWRFGLLRPRAVAAWARDRIAGFDIRTRGAAAPLRNLSGGNVQKVLLAREMSRQVRVAILAKPTQGLDARNAAAIRARIRAAAASGTAVLLVSSDLDEVLELSHRVAVMADGRIRAVLPNGPDAGAAVARLMSEAAP